MAKITKEYFKCDRCGVFMDNKPHYGEAGTFTVHFISDFAVAGNAVNWDDLCKMCNKHVGNFINNEINAAKLMREETKEPQ
jgi:hypothetical protein